MSNNCLKRINQRIHYRYSTTTIIKQCIRHRSTSNASTLPIPGKKYQNNAIAVNNTNGKSPNYAPWQHRSVTLHDQCYKLPQLIVARIESISNAKIETISTITPQQTDLNNNANINGPEIYGNTSSLSSFYPSEYFQITITGDSNSVDHAMQIYIHYSQNAFPLILETRIPSQILDVISKDCGCFIEKQNDFIYRIYPTTLNIKSDKENIVRMEQKIRKSIHRLNIPSPWHQNDNLMRLLFDYLKKQSHHKNLSFKSGAFFWYDRIQKDTDNDSDEQEQNEYFDDECNEVGYIWAYQNAQNKQILDIESELSSLIGAYTQKWKNLKISNKVRPILSAKKGMLWNYIKRSAKNEYNIDCILCNDAILCKDKDEKYEKFEEFVQRVLKNIVYNEINVDLSEDDRKALHQICFDYNLIYIIPANEAFISYYVGKQMIKMDKERPQKIKKEILKIIDPFYEPQPNVITNRVKSDQFIKIANSEKYHVIIRMFQYLEQTKGIIKDIKNVKKIKSESNFGSNLFYSILPKQRSIELTMESDKDLNDEQIQSQMSEIYEHLNNVQSVSVSIPILILLRGNTGKFANEFEKKFNLMMSSPPIRNIVHILNKHKEQKRFFKTKNEDENQNISLNEVTAKIYFYCKENESDCEQIYQYFENIIYRKIDLPIPIDMLYRATNAEKLNESIEIFKYYQNKYDLLCIANHPTKTSDDDKKLKYFNPQQFKYRYWIFAEDKEQKVKINECIKEMEQSMDECPFIDLSDMAPLISFLEILPKLKKQRNGVKCFLNVGNAKLYCIENGDKEKFDLLRNDLKDEIMQIKQKKFLSIPGHLYDDVVLFMVPQNFKRIQKVIRDANKKEPKYGFLWLTKFDGLNIFCESESVIQTIEEEVVKNIYQNSKIMDWSSEFDVDFNEYRKNKYLQQQVSNIMKQTNSFFAVRGRNRISGMPAMAITNYDKYELDAAHTKIFKLLSKDSTDKRKMIDNEQKNVNSTASSSNNDKQHLLPKPIILS